VNSDRFILLLPIAVLLGTSVGTCGAATAPSLSVVSLPEQVTLSQRQAAVVWDAQGNAYVATTVGPGEAGISSPPLPVTQGAAQAQPGLGICSVVATGIIGTMYYYCSNAFILKQQPNGSLVYATYLGGDKQTTVGGIALDAAGNVYVTGTTAGDFPTTRGAFLTTMPAGVSSTGFVAKLNPQGTQFAYVTYLPDGGTASGIALDETGNAYVTGGTAAGDLYAAKLSSDGSKLLYHTVLPGPSVGLAIAIDSNTSIYVTGQTASRSVSETTDGLPARAEPILRRECICRPV
jgi:Beta-propeller repeat